MGCILPFIKKDWKSRIQLDGRQVPKLVTMSISAMSCALTFGTYDYVLTQFGYGA